MKWLELNLAKTNEIEKQVDEVCRTVEALTLQLERQRTSNAMQVTKALDVLHKSIGERIIALDNFYRDNDMDGRSQKIEQCRIKLKKLLMTNKQLSARRTTPTTTHAGNLTSNTSSGLVTPVDTTPFSSPALGFASHVTSISNAAVSPPPGGATSPRPGNMSSSQGFYSSDREGEGGGVATSSSTHNEDNHNASSDVLVRIVMTRDEFEELQLRRMAVQQFIVNQQTPRVSSGGRGGAVNQTSRGR